MTETEVKSKIKLYIEANIAAIEERRKQPQFSWGELCELAQVDKVFSEKFRQLYRAYFRKYQTTVHKVQNQQPISDEQMAELYKTLTSNQIEFVEEEFKFLQGNENKDKGTKEFIFTAHRIPSEEEIVEHFNIDLKKYRISQIWHKTTPSNKYSISVNLQALKGESAVDYIKVFTDYINNADLNPIKNYERKEYSDASSLGLYMFTLPDLHIGNYQIENYVDKIKQAFYSNVYTVASTGIDEIVIANLGDLVHTDNVKNQTTSGTQLDSALSYEEAFTIALDLLSDLIEFAGSKFSKVTFVNVRGNHSFNTEYAIGEALKRQYRKDSNITILNSKDVRIYYKWNNNGFLFTHGERGVERLPLVFATEGTEVFGSTEYRHIMLGHLHHSSGKQFINDRKEFAGIEVRVLSSPTSNDQWHKNEGFCGNIKRLTSFIFTETEGKYAEFNNVIK